LMPWKRLVSHVPLLLSRHIRFDYYTDSLDFKKLISA
jgi:hypothetical protein